MNHKASEAPSAQPAENPTAGTSAQDSEDAPQMPPTRSKPLAIASLAVQLMAQGGSLARDAKDLSAAVKLASRILKEASRPCVEQAYEIFPCDAVMGMRDIANHFKERGWRNLTSHVTVNKLVRRLLNLMHRDIETRRAFLASAFRKRLGTPDPRYHSLSACEAITGLLREFGMTEAFGRHLDFAVERIWDHMVEDWMKADDILRAEMTQLKLISSSLFSEICVDESYAMYASRLRPHVELGADGLLDVMLWMDGPLRLQLTTDGPKDDMLDTLTMLNNWLEDLFPGDRRCANAFAECIVKLEMDTCDRATLDADFDMGVLRFCDMLAGIKLVGLSKEIASESALASFEDMVQRWGELDLGEKFDLSERLNANPSSSIQAVRSFLRGGMPLFTRYWPFVAKSESRIMRPYLRDLDSLHLALIEVEDLASQTGWTKKSGDLTDVKTAVTEEMIRVRQMAMELENQDLYTTQAMIAKGKELIKTSKSAYVPGRIKPHLLFRYASERGFLEDLVRSGNG